MKARHAIERVMQIAIESSCSCNRPGKGNGYLGHDKTCWVHIQRDNYKTVEAFIERTFDKKSTKPTTT